MQSIILLHGALGAASELDALQRLLEKKYIVHNINLSGHGGHTIPGDAFSIDFFAKQVLLYMQQNNIERTNIFGYSLGGYIGAYLAKYQREKIHKLITLATKFYWDETISAKEVKMLNPEIMQEKVPTYAKELTEKQAPNDWKKLVTKVAAFLNDLGNNNTLKEDDYTTITTPCLILLGDRDKMVTLDETLTVYKKLPQAEVGVLPNTPHQISRVDNELLAFLIERFLEQHT